MYVAECKTELPGATTMYICVTVHHWYNNINSQLDATIIILLLLQHHRYFVPQAVNTV